MKRIFCERHKEFEQTGGINIKQEIKLLNNKIFA